MFDFSRLFELRGNFFFGFFPILSDDVIAEVDTFITDIDRRPGDQLPNLITALATKRTPQVSVHLFLLSHVPSCVTYPWPRLRTHPPSQTWVAL